MASSGHHSAPPPSGEDTKRSPSRALPHDPPDGPDSSPGEEGARDEAPAAEQSSDAPELQVKQLRPAGLVAGGAASATASVLGGQLGVSGTVIGTFLFSIISATALALYTDSVNRTKTALATPRGKAHEKAATRSAGPAQSASGREPSAHPKRYSPTNQKDLERRSGRRPRRPRLVRILVLAVLMAIIGLGVVFGIQRATGTELSPGTGEIQRSVTGSDAVAPRDQSVPGGSEDGSVPDGQQDEDDAGADPRDGEAPGLSPLDQLEDDADSDGGSDDADAGAPADEGGSSGDQGSESDSEGDSSGSGSGGDTRGDSPGEQGGDGSAG